MVELRSGAGPGPGAGYGYGTETEAGVGVEGGAAPPWHRGLDTTVQHRHSDWTWPRTQMHIFEIHKSCGWACSIWRGFWVFFCWSRQHWGFGPETEGSAAGGDSWGPAAGTHTIRRYDIGNIMLLSFRNNALSSKTILKYKKLTLVIFYTENKIYTLHNTQKSFKNPIAFRDLKKWAYTKGISPAAAYRWRFNTDGNPSAALIKDFAKLILSME